MCVCFFERFFLFFVFLFFDLIFKITAVGVLNIDRLLLVFMGTPPAEELLRKIQELEEGQAHLKKEMSKLLLSGTAADSNSDHQIHHHHHHHQRSQSISPQRSRFATARRRGGAAGGLDAAAAAAAAWKRGSSSFRHSSPLQRESRTRDPLNAAVAGGGGGGGSGPAAVNFTNKQYLNILQSMGQPVYIFDLNYHIIYWYAALFLFFSFRLEPHFVILFGK